MQKKELETYRDRDGLGMTRGLTTLREKLRREMTLASTKRTLTGKHNPRRKAVSLAPVSIGELDV